ncbi:MAG TPA: hypothetical protein VF950_28850 [Planctomycetota bacterium]
MDREVRGAVVRYAERRRALSALLLAATVPLALAGWISGQMAFLACGAPLLVAALWTQLPARPLDNRRDAGTHPLAARGRAPRSIPLGDVRQVRAAGSAGRIEFWIDLPDGPLPAGQRSDVEAARAFARRMSEDLGCPLDVRDVR